MNKINAPISFSKNTFLKDLVVCSASLACCFCHLNDIHCHLCMFKLFKSWTLRNKPNINQGKKTTTLSTKRNARGDLGT